MNGAAARSAPTTGPSPAPRRGTPWVEAASVDFSVQAHFGLDDGAGSRSHSVTISGTLPQETFGPQSCRKFRSLLGTRIGGAVVQSLDGVLRAN